MAPEGITPQLDVDRLKDEIAKLRADMQSGLDGLRTQVQDTRLNRAEKYAEYMRNWLAILTLVFTGVFLGFGALGISRWSDLEASRKQMQTDINAYRTQMQADASDVSAKKNQVADIAQNAEQLKGGLEIKIQTVKSEVQGLENHVQTLQNETEKALKTAQQSRIDTQNLKINLVDYAGINPIIITPPFGVGDRVVSHIGGFNFGNSQGQLYAYVEESIVGLTTGLPSEPNRMEIQPSTIREWHDSDISFILSLDDYKSLEALRQRLQTANASTAGGNNSLLQIPSASAYLAFQVVTSDGRSSGISMTVPWPSAPTK